MHHKDKQLIWFPFLLIAVLPVTTSVIPTPTRINVISVLVFRHSLPSNLLINVDFPTPEEPMNATVFVFCRYDFICCRPSPVNPEVSITGTATATFSISNLFACKSSHKSIFVRIMTGTAPLPQIQLLLHFFYNFAHHLFKLTFCFRDGMNRKGSNLIDECLSPPSDCCLF